MALLKGFLLPLSLLWVIHSKYGALAASGDHNITTPITVVSAAPLTPTNKTFWVSPNKTFALGFLQVASNSPSFSLSLFYFELPQLETTVVWTVNRGQLVSANASLQLTEGGDLVLSDSGAQVWSTSTSGKGVSSAVVSDEGNLVLNGQNSSDVVWQSWDEEPTDTLLPGQSLLLGGSMVESKGRYWTTMQTDEMFVMYFLGALTEKLTTNYYWRANGSGMSIEQAYYNASDGLALYNKTGHNVQVLLQSSPSTQLQRIVLSESGVLTRYTLSADRRSWNPVIQIPSSICTVIGLCGQYGICNADAQNMTNYNCSCPDGFDFLVPNDWSAGCRSNYPLDCNLGTKMTRVAGLRYSTDSPSPDWDYHYYNEATTEDACAQTCNASCSCAAATYDGQYCHLCTLGQVNTGNRLKPLYITYLKTSAYPATNSNSSSSSLQLPSTGTQAGKSKIISTAAAVGIGIALGLACIVGIANLSWWHAKHKQAQNEEDEEGMEGEDQLPLLGGPAYFSYKELRAATNGFNQLLGRGGFGPVYKGVLAGGTLVAIKRLEGSTFGDKQFRAEVRTIGSVHHMNLVRLCGFCAKGHHRMLVYELMAKGSLDKYIFNDPQDVIDWQTRFQIVISTARAIKYLHEECQPCIVHCDIKPENILLDEGFNAKVSDFGMAQLVGGEANTGSITRVRGTAGYMAPEWTSSKRITSKADVYSFGIVVLEVMSGRRSIETEAVVSAAKMELSTWAYSQVVERCNPLALLDTRLLQAATSEASPLPPYPPHLTPEFQRAATVAFWCIHKDPSVRPSMGTVLQILEGFRSVDPPPYPF